ncbi:MAG: porin [Gammaproteobacteria bacterium]|nr:porin [Gammaproteobacteria bacterium]
MKFNCLMNRYYGLKVVGFAVATAVVSNVVQAGPNFQVGEQGYMQINYSLQMWMQNRSYTSPSDDGDKWDTFLRRNRITFTGQYNDYVGFYAQLEAGSDSKDGNDDKPIYYRDAYMTLDSSDSVRFIVGRYKNTFSRENLEACLEPLTLDRSMLSYTPFGGTRDTGATIWGNVADAMFQYRLSVSDGREDDSVVADTPRVTARIHASFFDPEYSYGYRGTYLGTQKVLTLGAAVDMQSDVAYGDFDTKSDPKDYKATTVDLFYEQPFDFGTLTLSSALFDYSLDGYPTKPDATMTPWTERSGNYVKVGYLMPKPVGMGRLQLFSRVDHTEYGDNTGLSDADGISFGMNYYINGQEMKVTLEHASTEFDQEDANRFDLQNNSLTTLGLQMIF